MSVAMKLLCVVVMVISGFAYIRCSDAESRKLNDVPYKNHRITTSSRNETRDKTYPVYAAQMYADLSNVKEFTVAGQSATVGEQPTKPTEEAPVSSLQDVVRVYITPTPTVVAPKRKSEPQNVPTTTQPSTPNVTPVALRTSSSAAHPIIFVTSSQSYGSREQRHKSAPASSTNQHFLYATTTQLSSLPQQSVAVGSSNKASLQSSGNASKPFTTVLVPKQMLDGGGDSATAAAVGYNGARDDPFRPIAAPSFSYAMQNTNTQLQQEPLNRRMSPYVLQSNRSVVRSKPSVAYRVQEEHKPWDKIDQYPLQQAKPLQQPQEAVMRKYVEITTSSEPVVNNNRYNKTAPSRIPSPSLQSPSIRMTVDQQQPVREYLPATRLPPPALLYSPPGKLQYESDKLTGLYSDNVKELPDPVTTPVWFTSAKSSTPPLQSEDDVSAKDVLKSLLHDLLKFKQRKPSVGGDEVIESYYKNNNRANVEEDFGLDDYDINTDMSCNLKSTKYITDGQCVTTKPIVEAMCADRCLVYDSGELFNQRQRSSLMNIKQDHNVEALHCIDGDVKLLRVQLKCRDGNTLNDVVRVVTNCRCKLHQIQPQMRNNVATGGSLIKQQNGMLPNQDIMNIVNKQF